MTMGCINSKNNLSEIRPNIYKVDSIDEDGTTLWHGQLEVCPHELVLHRKQKEPTKWSLKHLRRYGVDSDLFTFEAGRRCQTGEGIYAFRCNRAESLCRVLQSYIEGIASNEDTNSFLQNNTNACSDPISETINNLRQQQALLTNRTMAEQTCHQHGAHVDMSTHEANYLEPIATQSVLQRFSGGRFGSIGSSGPISPEIESSESLHSFTIIPDIVQKQNNSNGNVYQEIPIKQNESNNNFNAALCKQATETHHHTISLGVNMSHNDIVNSSVGSDDHMYVNVALGEDNIISPTSRFLNNLRLPNVDDSLRSYANINLVQPEITSKVEFTSYTSNEKSVPSTPLDKNESVGVNYIELDLDQSPSSQFNSAPKFTTTKDKSETGIVNYSVTKTTKENTFHSLTKSLSTGSGISAKNFNCISNPKLATKSTSQTRSIASGHLSPDSPKMHELEYAKIDINKTLALSNTTATNAELESKGARRTRHSSCVRQSNSISD